VPEIACTAVTGIQILTIFVATSYLFPQLLLTVSTHVLVKQTLQYNHFSFNRAMK